MLAICLAMLDAVEEKDKFEELYYKYRKIVHYIATEYMAENSLVEDATQETFLKLTKYIEKIESVDSPQTLSFVGIVTKSVCLDMLRCEKAYQKNTDKFHKQSSSAVETVSKVLEKIKALPEIYRDVLILKYYYDMPNKQIGDINNISVETVRKRIQRARELLSEVDS